MSKMSKDGMGGIPEPKAARPAVASEAEPRVSVMRKTSKLRDLIAGDLEGQKQGFRDRLREGK